MLMVALVLPAAVLGFSPFRCAHPLEGLEAGEN